MATILDKRYKGDRSTMNKKKFFIRYRRFIKDKIDSLVSSGYLKDVAKGSTRAKHIQIKKSDLHEPTFHFSGDRGTYNKVWVNNPKYIVGDKVYIRDRVDKMMGVGSGSGEGDEEGDQDFILTDEEFQKILFDHLSLPNFTKVSFGSETKDVRCRSGYSKTGSMSNLNLKKTFELSLARRVALDDIEAERFPFIDDLDLRYNYFSMQKKPLAQAVLFCVMDVSGSMSQEHKLRAKQFYYLMTLFLRRMYKAVELVFIIHTDEAEEVTEARFFDNQESGATLISSGLALTDEIIKQKYNPLEWNIYCVSATDGDNWPDDNVVTERLMTELLGKVQYLIGLLILPNSRSEARTLLSLYSKLEKEHKNFGASVIFKSEDIGKTFYKFFSGDK